MNAVKHPHVNALGHPTGRIINKRAPYRVEMEEVIAAAAGTGTFLELNAAPDRLDVDDNMCRAARDAHSVNGYDFMRYGVNQARRGWLERGDLINTLTYRS